MAAYQSVVRVCCVPHTRITGWYDCVHHCGTIKSAFVYLSLHFVCLVITNYSTLPVGNHKSIIWSQETPRFLASVNTCLKIKHPRRGSNVLVSYHERSRFISWAECWLCSLNFSWYFSDRVRVSTQTTITSCRILSKSVFTGLTINQFCFYFHFIHAIQKSKYLGAYRYGSLYSMVLWIRACVLQVGGPSEACVYLPSYGCVVVFVLINTLLIINNDRTVSPKIIW
jgi:hypothetical protein